MEDATQFVRVFGGAAVLDAGEPVSIGGPRQRRLLALFVTRPDTVVSIDWLAEYVWDDHDRPEQAESALRTIVSRLRRSFPPPADQWIQTEASGYRFTAPAEAVDVRKFELLRAAARRAREGEDPDTALRLLDEGVTMTAMDNQLTSSTPASIGSSGNGRHGPVSIRTPAVSRTVRETS
jgi:DNA-binding SARP family transcriptional activator